LPASTWAMIPMLRMSAKGVVRAMQSSVWIQEVGSGKPLWGGVFRGADGREKWEELLGGLLEDRA
jgi:hypothetical protein